jgi:DNA polymerase-3 subunit delta'
MSFGEIHGHRHLVELLTRSIRQDSLPPSLIFAGPAGVGKRLTATALAQALNCLTPIDGDACGTCAACTRIARGVHPDVMIVEPGDTGSIKVEQVRDIVDRAAYRPFEGKRRAVIVDDADQMVTAAQNALLKTLEEPPAASVFLLVTSRPDMLLPTVRSRCPMLRFGPLSEADVAAALQARGQKPSEAVAAAAASEGSLGRALAIDAEERLVAREAAERVLAVAAAVPEPGRRIDVAKELLVKARGEGGTEREQLALRLRAMASLLRDAALLASRADANSLANPDVRPVLDKLAKAYGGDRGLKAFESIDRALAALTGNAGVKVVADWIVLQL